MSSARADVPGRGVLWWQVAVAAAVGGELTIESAPGEGTSVLGVISQSRSG